MLVTDIVALARTAERLRFRIRHHLGGDPGRLEGLMADLNQLNPWHPIALNDRAERALPETFAPAPSLDIAPAARLFQQGDIEGALASATTVAAHDPPSLLVQADLMVLLGQNPSSVLQRAFEALGPLAVVRLRLSRMHLASGQPKQAFAEAAHALASNPVYGSAREAHGLACAGLGHTRVSIPVRSPVRFLAGHAHYPDTLSPRARAAWRAWTGARDGQDLHTVPPSGPAHRALLQAWRAHPDEPAFYREDPNTELKVLDRWDRENVLEAYEWSSGLSFRNAAAFRKYKKGADNGALLKFWKSGVLQLPVQA